MGKPESRVAQVRVKWPVGAFCGLVQGEVGRERLHAAVGSQQVAPVGTLQRVAGRPRPGAEGPGQPNSGTVRGRAPDESRREPCTLPASLSLALLLDAVREAGVLVDEEPALAEASAVEALLAHFQRHLVGERGVKAETADTYVSHARRFVAGQVPSGELRSLQARDVTAAVLAESSRVSVAPVRTFVASLRAFLRFCFLEGLLDLDLSEAALAVGGGRRRSSLPRGVSSSDADALLRSCERRTAMGRRDYAVILLLLRLGLRAGEVAALRLDDIDWRSGEIVVNGKGSRLDRLPLPADVGRAIAAYLARGRPRCPRREVFLRALAPLEGLGRVGISYIVRRASERGG